MVTEEELVSQLPRKNPLQPRLLCLVSIAHGEVHVLWSMKKG